MSLLFHYFSPRENCMLNFTECPRTLMVLCILGFLGCNSILMKLSFCSIILSVCRGWNLPGSHLG